MVDFTSYDYIFRRQYELQSSKLPVPLEDPRIQKVLDYLSEGEKGAGVIDRAMQAKATVDGEENTEENTRKKIRGQCTN
jgi:hypothetical protein